WALGQRVERPRTLTRRDEELAGALRCRRHQHRRLDLDEALPLHGPAYGGVHGRVDREVALHAVTPQIEIAVLQAHDLVDLRAIVERERWRFRDVEDLDRAVADFYFAGRQLRVDRPLGSGAHCAGDAHDILGAQVVRAVHDALDQTCSVTQI